MGDEWIVFERGHVYQIGRYYFGLFSIQKIEWYKENSPNYGGSSTWSIWQTSTKGFAVTKAKEINVELFNAEAQSKTFNEDHWKEVT